MATPQVRALQSDVPEERAVGNVVVTFEPEPAAALRATSPGLYERCRLPLKDVLLQRPQYLFGFLQSQAEVLQPLAVLLQHGELYDLFRTLLLVFGHQLQPEL